jgi:hypothetical protein
MSVETVSPEELAKLVHRYREALAPDFGLRPGNSPEWGDIPPQEQRRMVAATRLALLDLANAGPHRISGEMPSFARIAGGSEGKECGC